MKNRSACPWYIWIFSFFALFVLAGMTMFRVAADLFRKKVKYDVWLKLLGEILLDWVVLFMLPVMLFSILGGTLLPTIWKWLALPAVYALGFYPAMRMWRWRKKNLQNSSV